MRYIVLFILLSGCATNDFVRLDEQIKSNLTESEHRDRAKEMNISYVDYLHLYNNNKLEVKKSYLKLSHNNK